MIALLYFFIGLLAFPFKSTCRLEAENTALRYQLIVLRRKVRGRVELTNEDRLFFILLYRWFPSIVDSASRVGSQPVVRRHRAVFRRYWHWKASKAGGRPPARADLRASAGMISHVRLRSEYDRIHEQFFAAKFAVLMGGGRANF